MNIESKRTNYNWNEVTISKSGIKITSDIVFTDAQEFKDQLLDVINDLDLLIEEHKKALEVIE